MKMKLVILLAYCFALSFAPLALAQHTGGTSDGHAMGISASDQSLPVQLSTFTATVSDGDVILKWVTQTEVNNIGFAIYRSESAGEDSCSSSKYTKVSFVTGAGSTAMSTDYQYTDKEVESGKTYFYYIEDVDVSGVKTKNRIIKVIVPPKFVPTEFRLLQNFPNPFNPETWIPYQLTCNAEVTIRIYNVFGRLVNTLSLGVKETGYYTTKDEAACWDGRNSAGEQVASGVYLYTIQAGEFFATRRMVIIK
ncbi:T9SS type A sorting domain-containing protein [bacterium]|nr:T9SS type A sorting domain-containing protein [bacterium]